MSTSSILGTGADKARQWRRIVSISSVKWHSFWRRLRFSETLSASVWCVEESAAAPRFTFRPRGGMLFLGRFSAYNYRFYFQPLFYFWRESAQAFTHALCGGSVYATLLGGPIVYGSWSLFGKRGVKRFVIKADIPYPRCNPYKIDLFVDPFSCRGMVMAFN